MRIPELYQIFKKNNQVSTDSRKVEKGDIFFALRGPTFNGNEYAQGALDKGANYAVIDDENFKKSEQYIVVEDVLKCLQLLATHHRNQFNIPFIAIAGSNGKTTTKELIRDVLKTTFETFATKGNFNNEIGVPLTLLDIGKDAEMAVIEVGARYIGDIRELCEIAKPTHGIITNTGKDHLETFKTLENTRRTNAELYQYLKENDGTAFINIADDDLLKEAASLDHKVTYGKYKKADYYGELEASFPNVKLRYGINGDQVKVESKLTGQYNFENLMAAIAVGKHFGVNDNLIKKAIEHYVPKNNRSQVVKINGNTFILDAYNANPTSMKAAIDNLAGINARNKAVVLGDMLELGHASYEEHLLITMQLKTLNLSEVVLLGPEFGKVKDKINCHHFDSVEQAKDWFNNQHFKDTTFLLKGSRKIGVEKLIS